MIFLGKNIRYLRKRKGMSQRELADLLGKNNYTTVQKWETGKADPPFKVVHGLSEYFGVNMDDLVYSDLEHDPRGLFRSNNIELSDDEKELIHAYNSADLLTKQMIRRLLGIEMDKEKDGADSTLSEIA